MRGALVWFCVCTCVCMCDTGWARAYHARILCLCPSRWRGEEDGEEEEEEDGGVGEGGPLSLSLSLSISFSEPQTFCCLDCWVHHQRARSSALRTGHATGHTLDLCISYARNDPPRAHVHPKKREATPPVPRISKRARLAANPAALCRRSIRLIGTCLHLDPSRRPSRPRASDSRRLCVCKRGDHHHHSPPHRYRACARAEPRPTAQLLRV